MGNLESLKGQGFHDLELSLSGTKCLSKAYMHRNPMFILFYSPFI